MSIERGSTVLIFRNLLNRMARASLFHLRVNDTKSRRALIRVKHCETYFICYLFLPLHLSCIVYLPATVNLSPTITHLEL